MSLTRKSSRIGWETPRNLWLLVVAAVIVASAFGGWVGYGIGQQTRQAPLHIVFEPGAVQLFPVLPAKQD